MFSGEISLIKLLQGEAKNLLKIGCPLNSNQKNDKKMTIFVEKQERKALSQNVPKNTKKALWKPSWKNKLVSKHKYGTLACFKTSNLCVL